MEANGLFNDALNTFYLRLYGVRHMVKDHSGSERGNPLPSHRQQGFFYMHHPPYRITHTTAFVTLAGRRNSSMGPPFRIDPTTHRTMSERSYHKTKMYHLDVTDIAG